MTPRTEYTATTHDVQKGAMFSAPAKVADEPAWELEGWRLEHGTIVALWVRKWPGRS